MRPIANQYREGKVKRTPMRGVKQTLKPCAYKRSEHASHVTACLLHNEPTSCRLRQAKALSARAKVKASLNRAYMSEVADAKPSDLHMSRMKSR